MSASLRVLDVHIGDSSQVLHKRSRVVFLRKNNKREKMPRPTCAAYRKFNKGMTFWRVDLPRERDTRRKCGIHLVKWSCENVRSFTESFGMHLGICFTTRRKQRSTHLVKTEKLCESSMKGATRERCARARARARVCVPVRRMQRIQDRQWAPMILFCDDK
jgi:hypothetical protein